MKKLGQIGRTSALGSGAFCFVLVCSVSVHSEPVRVELVTRILSFDPQAGMKSTQVLLIDFDKKTIKSLFSTGVTAIGPIELGSVRDKFVVDNIDFGTPGRVGFTARGQTASGVLFMPNINYKFNMAVTPKGTGAFSGCHDGYPAYRVAVSGKAVYEFLHESLSLIKLFGECDVQIKGIVEF